MKKSVLLSLIFGLWMTSPLFALVPGPILLTDEQLLLLQQAQDQVVNLPQTRSGGACLKLDTVRLCAGAAAQKTHEAHVQLPPDIQKRVLIYTEKERSKAVLVLFPAQVSWMPSQVQEEPYVFGPDAQKFEPIREQIAEVPVQVPFASIFPGQVSTELMTWFYSQEHIGFITQKVETVEYVIGVFVTQ